MEAVLLVGGLGTRLKSVVNDRPKPLADVCGRPFLEYLLLQLKRYGIAQIVMAVGYKGDMIQEYFGEGSRLGIHIEYSYEESQLGTAGAIKNALPYLSAEEFLVLNGDTFYEAAYGELISFYKESGVNMALVLRQVPDISRYGSVQVENHVVKGFNEKKTEQIPGTINGGIYLMKRSLLEYYVPQQQKYSLENEMIPAMLRNGETIGAVVNEGYFIDIGVPEDYYSFINDVRNGIIRS